METVPSTSWAVEAVSWEAVPTTNRDRECRAGVASKVNSVLSAGDKLGVRHDLCWEGTHGKAGFDCSFPFISPSISQEHVRGEASSRCAVMSTRLPDFIQKLHMMESAGIRQNFLLRENSHRSPLMAESSCLAVAI